MRKIIHWLFIVCLIAFFLPKNVLAKVGVGVGVGKIEVDEILTPGSIYDLPDIPVINTGDVVTTYEIGVAYHNNQKELKPESGWFIFKPESVEIYPQESKLIDVKLNLPLNTEPGSYFAYLEAQPKVIGESGVTKVGIAAASKLSFTVAPASFGMAVYYKIKSFFSVYTPWPQRALIVVGVVLFIFLFKKFFKFEVNLKKK